MKLEKLAGTTSEIWEIFIQDKTSTVGAGLPGLLFNTATLTATYHRNTAVAGGTAITLVTMTVGTFTSGGFKEIDATLMPGWYQFCPPDAALAAGAKSCSFHLKGAGNMADLPIEVQLVAVDPDNATSYGISRLDATISSRMATFTLPTNFSSFSIDASGRVDVIKVNGTSQTAGDIYALLTLVATYVDTEIAAIKFKTDFLPSIIAGGSGGLLISGANTGTTTLGALTITGITTFTGNFLLSDGIIVSAPSTINRAGISVTGNGSGAGFIIQGGSLSGDGLKITGGNTGNGINTNGGAISGDGLLANGNVSGHGFRAIGVGTTKHGFYAIGGTTTSDGARFEGGGTGNGITANSGTGTTGDGAIFTSLASIAGNGLKTVGVGGDGAGGSGHGFYALSGTALLANGIRAVSNSTVEGAGISGVGSAAGSGFAGIGGSGGGRGFHGMGGTGSGEGARFEAQGGGSVGLAIVGIGVGLTSVGGSNSDSVRFTGTGSGHGLRLVAGATGNGLKVTTTAGDGVSISPTGGHALVLTANGTSKHGLIATGGTAGVSDGIKATAGTGGVDIRGNITGNIIGTLDTLTTYTGNSPQTGDSFARIGANGVGLTAVGLTANGLDTVIMSDLAGPPAANAKITAGLSWLFMSVQNDRKTTSTQDKIHNSAAAVVGTATVSDDGTTYEKTAYA